MRQLLNEDYVYYLYNWIVNIKQQPCLCHLLLSIPPSPLPHFHNRDVLYSLSIFVFYQPKRNGFLHVGRAKAWSGFLGLPSVYHNVSGEKKKNTAGTKHLIFQFWKAKHRMENRLVLLLSFSSPLLSPSCIPSIQIHDKPVLLHSKCGEILWTQVYCQKNEYLRKCLAKFKWLGLSSLGSRWLVVPHRPQLFI